MELRSDFSYQKNQGYTEGKWEYKRYLADFVIDKVKFKDEQLIGFNQPKIIYRWYFE